MHLSASRSMTFNFLPIKSGLGCQSDEAARVAVKRHQTVSNTSQFFFLIRHSDLFTYLSTTIQMNLLNDKVSYLLFSLCCFCALTEINTMGRISVLMNAN